MLGGVLGVILVGGELKHVWASIGACWLGGLEHWSIAGAYLGVESVDSNFCIA